MEFFDTHAHYNDEKFEESRENLLKKIYEEGITTVVCAGYDVKSSIKAIEIANAHDFVYAIVGISPNDIDNVENEDFLEIENLAKDKKVVAIGEIGLDYYWNTENKEKQKEVFIKQIEIANRLELPIVIHTREATVDTIDILKNHTKPIKNGIIHCCPLNQELVKEVLKLGFYISFAGPVTFKNSKNADLVISEVPTTKILIETDSPYLSPEPVRGTINDSRNVKYIAEKIAKVKNMKLEDVANVTYENAKKIFNI